MVKNPEYSVRTPSMNAIELAGALQGVMNSVETADFSLHDHQDEAIQAIGTSLINGDTSGYVEMATSTGKTAVEALVAQAAVAAGKRVLLLAPKISIARQISGKGQPSPSGLARFTDIHEQTSVGHYLANERARPTDQVVVSTYNSFLNDAERGHDRLGQFDVVIGDECHRSLGSKTAAALTSSFPDAIKVGFSATPDFAVDRKSEEIFGKKMYEFSLIDAIQSGKTAAIRALLYETDEQLAVTDTAADFTARELAPFIENIQRNGTAMKLVKEFVNDGRKGIVRCIPGSGNAHARLLAEQLTVQYAVRAEAIGSHMTQAEQQDVYRRLANGEIDCLTSTKAVEEGFDSDVVSFFINVSPTTSPVATKQSMGRILRHNPDGRESIYVDFVDRTSGIQKPQYTALHALDLETVDFNRVLGRHNNVSSVPFNADLNVDLGGELLQRIMRSNGKLLTDVLTQRSENNKVDILQRKWERILELEGLPATLPENIAFDAKLNAKYELGKKAAKHAGVEPSHGVIMDHIPRLSAIHSTVLGKYGLQLSLEDMMDDEPDERSIEMYPFEEVENNVDRSKTIESMWQALSLREYEVLRLRWLDTAVDDGSPETLDLIARTYGLSRARIRQIELKAFEKVRQSDKTRGIESKKEGYEDMRRAIQQRFDTAYSQQYRSMVEYTSTDTYWLPPNLRSQPQAVDAEWVHKELSSYVIEFPDDIESNDGMIVINAVHLLSQQYTERRELAAKHKNTFLFRKYQHILDVLSDMEQRSRDGSDYSALIEYYNK